MTSEVERACTQAHHPTLLSSGHGCWATCSCGGWQSTLYTTVTGAHLAFGQHLTQKPKEGRL